MLKLNNSSMILLSIVLLWWKNRNLFFTFSVISFHLVHFLFPTELYNVTFVDFLKLLVSQNNFIKP